MVFKQLEGHVACRSIQAASKKLSPSGIPPTVCIIQKFNSFINIFNWAGALRAQKRRCLPILNATGNIIVFKQKEK